MLESNRAAAGGAILVFVFACGATETNGPPGDASETTGPGSVTSGTGGTRGTTTGAPETTTGGRGGSSGGAQSTGGAAGSTGGGAQSTGGAAGSTGGAAGSTGGAAGSDGGQPGCSINSDCNDPFVCAFHRCHRACQSSRDCSSGRCVMVKDPDTGALLGDVCQLDDEARCTLNAQCPGSEICAIDGRCRDQCNLDRDCITGQVCRTHACADSNELSDAGMLQPILDGGRTSDGASP